MKNNKNRFLTLLIISLILNLVLLFFLFPKNQVRFRFWVMNIFGFARNSQIPKITPIFLQDFQPISQLKTEPTKLSFPSIPFIESHGHLGKYFQTTPETLKAEMDKVPILYFINLSFTTREKFLELKKEYSDPRIIHFSTFDWRHVSQSEDYVNLILQDLKMDIQNGTKGIKLWKDFGLHVKKKNGERLRLNDPSLDPIFEECARNQLIISIHTVDPKAFFDPIDEKNERYLELMNRPEWSFYGEKFPKFEEVLQEREALFKRHPNLTFIALHFGELSHDLKEADRLLRENPNVYFDIAARIDELGRQPYSAREFLIKWQDRILFGTDGPIDLGKLEIYARFLETKDEYFDYHPPYKPKKGFWKIYGLGLPKEVLEKIYFKNAMKVFRLTNPKK